MSKTVSSCGGLKMPQQKDIKTPAQIAKEKQKASNTKGKK